MSRAAVHALRAAAAVLAFATMSLSRAEAGDGIPRPIGSQFRYRVALEASLETVDDDRGSPAMSFSLRGDWTATVVATPPGQTWFRARFESPFFELAGSDAAAAGEAGEVDRLRAHFSRPYLQVVGADGAVLDMRLEPDTSGLVQTTLKTMAALAQLVEAPGAEESWATDEPDTTGLYSARYRRAADGTVSKVKSAYRWISAGRGAQAPPEARVEVLDSEARFWRSADGFLERLEARDRVRFAGLAPLPPAESATRLMLERIGKDEVAVVNEEIERWAAGLSGGPLYGGPSEEAFAYEIDRVKIGGLDFEKILAQLSSLGEGEDDRRTEGRLYLALTALLRRDAGALRAAVEHVRGRGRWTATLIAALGHAGSPAAQEGLGELLASSPRGDGRRPRLALALSFVDRPTERTVDTLTGLLDDPEVGVQSHYGLGAATYYLRDRDPELARRAVATLVNRLEAATSPRGTKVALRALGNAGHPASLEVLKPYLQSADPEIRGEAVRAQRRMPGGRPAAPRP